jgi:steroid 5-alpha reductase family enzyme
LFALRSYVQIFLLQGTLMLVVGMPVLVAGFGRGPSIGMLDYVGVAIWLIGFLYETVADFQLLLFKRNPENRGAIMTKGLWRYSRHPNYFGEALLWWGPFLIALGTPFGIWTVISPLTIAFLLLRVSGIPMLEKKYENRQDFAAYKDRTNAFIPWPPKKCEPDRHHVKEAE